jgi:efflux transporter, RND family, MFP subunit
MKKILIPAALLLLAACNQPTQPGNTGEATPVEAEPVQAEVSETITDTTEQVDAISSATAMPNHSSFNGTLMVPPQRHATVTLTMGGTVHSTTLLPGDYVKKGTVLATLENPDFILLQQNYLDAHAQTEYMETEYARQQRLASQEAASQKRLQQSKADYLSMKSRLEAAAAQLTILGVPAEELLQKGIRPYLEVKSPLNGYVANMAINLGKYINAGEPICDIIDKGETLICLTAYEKDLENLEAGKRIQFRVNGMGEQTFHATVLSIGQVVDETNRSLEIYGRVKESNPRFRPGMYVSARVEK